MSSSKNSEDLYRPIIKDGTHLAPSRKTPNAYRGTQLSDVNNQVDGQAEWVKVESAGDQRKMAIGEAIVVAGTIWVLSEVVTPRVRSWWQEKAVPSIKRAWQGLSDKKSLQKITSKKQLRDTQIIEARSSVPNLSTQKLNEAYEKYTNNMTNEEAQRELLDIFILSTVVAAKMRKLANARIKDKGDKSGAYIEGKAVIERLSTPQFINSINVILENNTQLLEEISTPLTEILGRSLIIEGRYVPIERNALEKALSLK